LHERCVQPDHGLKIDFVLGPFEGVLATAVLLELGTQAGGQERHHLFSTKRPARRSGKGSAENALKRPAWDEVVIVPLADVPEGTKLVNMTL
jgi:hypothetical protein